ncbi:cytochrome P450, partial [Mycena albidolilacea]
IPHFITAEDEYQGYRIPANSIVIGNTCSVHSVRRTVYPEPYTFQPERFLLDDGSPNPVVPDPAVAFGYGRRLCPDRHMSSASLWIIVSSVLATFEITKVVDENGSEIEPSYGFDSGLIKQVLAISPEVADNPACAVLLSHPDYRSYPVTVTT